MIRRNLALVAISVVVLASCSSDSETPGAETARFLIDEVPGLEREAEGLNGSGALTRERLLKLGFSRNQAKLFEASDAKGYVRVWVAKDDPNNYIRTWVFQLPSNGAASKFTTDFVKDAADKGAATLPLPGFEEAAGYKYAVGGGFNVAIFQRDDLVFALAGNDVAAGEKAEDLAKLALAQQAQAPGPRGTGDDNDGGPTRVVAALVAALLAAGVLGFAVRERFSAET